MTKKNTLKNKPFVFIVYGPTGVGKTSLVDDLAKEVSLEIINGDVGQFYKPFTIGTAKPDWKNYQTPHHLFDIIDQPKSITVAEYRKLICQKVDEVSSRGNLPVIVGGSGFYLKSLFYPPIIVNSINKNSEKIDFDNLETFQLWDKLHEIDSKRAKQIDYNDRYRLERALLLWQKTGAKPSSMVPVYDPPFNYELVFLTRERKQLYDRINYRTNIMLNDGWITEVESICGTMWQDFLYEKKIIGYDILLDYCLGDKSDESLNAAISLIQKKTRNYAKRQHTFWNSFSKQLFSSNQEIFGDKNFFKIYSINLTLLGLSLYLKQLSERLKLILKK